MYYRPTNLTAEKKMLLPNKPLVDIELLVSYEDRTIIEALYRLIDFNSHK